ncbi:MAG: hypothetical protein KDD90_12065, partial [Sphingomonadaceae bacterium]|nr:hypothetical protein [Sphingomonadaceae bacterium]
MPFGLSLSKPCSSSRKCGPSTSSGRTENALTVSQAIREATERLSATSPTARLDAELLMAHALGVSRSDMLLRGSDMVVPPDFGALVERRIAREPVAYILGEQEFYGRGFRVTSDVLIPRGDSETVIEA